tara:strand:- start:679 stop:1110 length:432 start_codon:yes stop_codon:yes gene_type:complete
MENSNISVEIYNAKPLSFQVNSEVEFNGEINLKNINLSLITEFQIDEESSTVAIKVDLAVLLKSNGENLFSLTSFFEFGIFDLKDVLIERSGRNILESNFARKLLNISIGGTRGMLSVYLSSTEYKDFTLPIANIPDDFFDDK